MFQSQTKQDEINFFNQSIKDGKYDEHPAEFYEEIFISMKLPKRNTAEMALDVGCGSGAWGIRLSKKGYTVIGVDISRNLLNSAKNWAKEENVDFSLILCDVEWLPLKDESFKVCWCGYVLHHFKKLNKIFPELSRVLDSSGEIFAAEPNGSNIVNNLSRKLMTLFPQQWVMEKGIATSNERTHEIRTYINTFNETNFSPMHFWTLNRNKTKLATKRGLIGLLSAVRNSFFSVFESINTGPTGKTELLMRATKKS